MMLTRYDIHGLDMCASQNGSWVTHQDYARLEKAARKVLQTLDTTWGPVSLTPKEWAAIDALRKVLG